MPGYPMCARPGSRMLLGMRTALHHPRFGRLLAALAASQLGDWLYNIALLVYVQERTHSAVWLGLTTAARIAPMVIGGPFGGVLADRANRRTLMIAADVVRAALMGLLTIAAIASAPVVVIPLLAAAATMASVVYPPCVAAVTPRLVPEDVLGQANAARAAIVPAAVFIGPALGGLLMLLGPPSLAFAVNALTFVASAMLVLSIRGAAEFERPRRDAQSAAGILADLRTGLLALRDAPAAGRLVSADIAASFVYGSQTVLLVLVAHRLGLGTDGYGYLLAAQGAGGIVGAAIAGRIASRAPRPAVQVIALVMVAAPLPLLAITGSLAVALILGVIAGAGALIAEVVADTGLQLTIDDERLGSAYGFVFAASVGGIAAGALIAPLLVSIGGLAGALTMIAAAVAVLAARIGLTRRPLAVALPVQQA